MRNYVFYDDTDCGGIVYHSNYITFCERARSLIFFNEGIMPHVIDSKDSNNAFGFVVKSIESNFISTLKFGDIYEVKSKIFELKHSSINIAQDIYKLGSVGDFILDSKITKTREILSFSAKIKLAYKTLP